MSARVTRSDRARTAARAALIAACALAAASCGPRGVEAPSAVSASSPDEDPAGREILRQIVQAETSLAYHGFRSVTQGPRGASRETRLRVVHTADDRTLLAWGDDAGDARRWRSRARLPWLERPDLLLRNYRVALDPAPSDPVAWRPTRRVTIEGRRTGRPSAELLVDAETWLVLAESARDAGGDEWRHAAFESLEYGAPPGDASEAAADPCEPTDPGEPGLAGDQLPVGWVPLVPSSIPAGFERIAAGRSSCGAWREDWTDGLAVFSLLQVQEAAVAPQGASHDEPRGDGDVTRRRWLGGAALATTRAGISVTLFGTLGAEDLLPVLRGLRAPAPDR